MIGVRQSFVMVRPLWRVEGEMASHFDVAARDSWAMATHRWLRRTLGLGLLAGAAYAVWRTIEANRVEHDQTWEPQPFPFPPQPRAPASIANDEAWVAPVDAECPLSHPVKVKLSSGIFHLPGGQSYERTVPDRCYVDRASAEAAGFRAAKR